jgi:hypothetical protein
MKNKKGLIGAILILGVLLVVGFIFFKNSITGNVIHEENDEYVEYCESFGYKVGTSFYDNGEKYTVCIDDNYKKCDIEEFYKSECLLG